MKKFSAFFIIILLFSVFLFGEESITTIKILNAQKTEYKKSEETGNDSIVLEGSVEISVTKDSATTTVTANKVSFDRETKIMYADGNVKVSSNGSGGGIDDATATSLILNTTTMEGVFDDGRVVQTKSESISLPSGSVLVVFADIFGKSESNTIAFKNASLTFCDDLDPHWHIKASKIWLLPGGEFAFVNALLFVGPVPVLYFPAFYYPKDELVFNPVIGYKKREGYFINTTTYIYGRKPLADSSSSSSSSSTDDSGEEALKSLYNFMKPSTLKQQKLEGIVLRNLDEDYSGDTSNYIKIMTDWYSNLGFFTGVSGNLTPKDTIFSKLAFDADFGFSNVIYDVAGGDHTKYNNNGTIDYEHGNFLGWDTPFRYKFNIDVSIKKPLNVTLTMPVYSDPFFQNDFLDRSENSDWISSLMDLFGSKEDKSISEISSFNWNLNASYSPSLPQFIKPYVSSVSAKTTSTVNFASKADKNSENPKSIKRKFYYPSILTPVNASMSLSGTIFQWPVPVKSKSSKKTSFVVPLVIPEDIMTPSEKESWEKELANRKELALKREAENSNNEGSDSADSKSSGKENEDQNSQNSETAKETENSNSENQEVKNEFEPVLPSLKYTASSDSSVQGLQYSLAYSTSPAFTSQITYNAPDSPEQIKFDTPKAMAITFKSPTTLTSNLSYGGSFLSAVNKLSYDPVYQSHPVLLEALYDEENKKKIVNDGYTETQIASIRKADFEAFSQAITNSNTFSFNPFYYTNNFKETGVSWNTNLKLLRLKFLGDVDNPEWETLPFGFDDEECVTANSLSLKLGTNQLDNKFKQSLSFTATLPPQKDDYNATLSLVFPYVNMSFAGGFYKKVNKTTTNIKNENGETVPVTTEDEEWLKDPFQQSLSVTVPVLGSNMVFSESYNYNLEEEHSDSFKASLSWANLSLSYIMSYALTYILDVDHTDGDGNLVFGTGWIQDGTEKQFVPYSLSLSYSMPSKTIKTFKNRISIAPTLSTSINADLLKYTNSSFTFSPGIKFTLNKFLDVSFSATSKNSAIATYFDDSILGYRKNIFEDLWNSFRFDNESLRKSSGFKLKSLNMSVSHDLHDWKFNMTMKVEPRLIDYTDDGGNKKKYDFSPYITLGVVWTPMEAIKTRVIDKYGDWQLE